MYTISDVYFLFLGGNYIIDFAFPEASERREPGEPSPCLHSASRFQSFVFSEKTKDPPQSPWGALRLRDVSHWRDPSQRALVWGFWKTKFTVWVQLFCIFNTKYTVSKMQTYWMSCRRRAISLPYSSIICLICSHWTQKTKPSGNFRQAI